MYCYLDTYVLVDSRIKIHRCSTSKGRVNESLKLHTCMCRRHATATRVPPVLLLAYLTPAPVTCEDNCASKFFSSDDNMDKISSSLTNFWGTLTTLTVLGEGLLCWRCFLVFCMTGSAGVKDRSNRLVGATTMDGGTLPYTRCSFEHTRGTSPLPSLPRFLSSSLSWLLV